MNKHCAIVVLLIMFTLQLEAQFSFPGKWIGTIKMQGVELDIHFNVKETKVSKDEIYYLTKVDVPAQRLKNYAIDQTSLKKKNVAFEITSLGAKFKGKIIDTNIIQGVFEQRGKSISLKLTKHWGPLKLDKPQTPKVLEYTYLFENVSFSNNDGKIKFAGTLTHPAIKNEQKFPAVILFTGSGSQDRDESIGNHKPFAVISNELTKAGFAVLRVDDRGAGETKMSPEKRNFTTADLIDDGLSYLNFLLKDSRIDTNKIFLFGHSEGGSIAIGVARKSSKIRGIIGMAPTLASRIQINTYQNYWALKNSGSTENDITSYLFLHEMILNEFVNHDTLMSELEISNIVNHCVESWKSSSKLPKNHYKSVIKSFENLYKAKFIPTLVEIYKPLNQMDWMRYFIKSNEATELVHIRIPALILMGKLDQQIPYDQNKEAVDQLKLLGRNIDFVGFEGLNHLMQHCKTGSVNEYLSNEETISMEVIETMIQWLNRNK
jgi:predicted esterase